MIGTAHIGNELLVRALDDELLPEERAAVEEHLAGCEDCAGRYGELRTLSVRLDAVFDFPGNARSMEMEAGRRILERALVNREQVEQPRNAPSRGKIVAWSGMAAAAVIAIAMVALPRPGNQRVAVSTSATRGASSANFEIGDESFVPLPYSNTDLPMTSTHVVRMEIPVSSLLDAGVMFEPISRAENAPDRSVLADVLVGIDGEPLGVHVVGSDDD